MTRVYVEGNDHLIRKMFRDNGYELADTLLDADLLCVEGGADVTPALYGEENTHSGNSPQKDQETFGLISMAHHFLHIPVVGICRGSQAICVFNGGKMKQHIGGHGRDHTLTFEGKEYYVSSTHHQESVPALDERFIWRADDGVCEAAFYPETQMLGTQFHPEYFGVGDDCPELFFTMLTKFLEVRG